MVHYVPMKNPSSLKLFKLKVKCWCYRDCISWRWPWLMWNMTWGKWISAQCGEIICEMLPLYQSLFVCEHMPVCVWESVCMWVLYACPCMKGSAYTPHSAEGTWSGEQHAETAAAHRSSKQLNMSCCQMNWVSCSEITPSLHQSYDFDSNAELYLITMSYYYR